MRFFGKRRPNVKSLAKAGEVEGLVDATQYREVRTAGDGGSVDAGASIREDAVLALAETATDADREQIVRSLTDALADPVDRVRCAAVMTLYRLGEADPLARVVPYLPPDRSQARATASRALLALRAPGSSATLAAAFLHRGDELALGKSDADLVATLIREEGTPDAAPTVIELAVASLADERAVVAFRAEELLERLGPASRDSLVEELKHGRGAHRAAGVLGRMKDSRALASLVAALEHPDPHVRSESCAALGELRDPAAAEALLVATRDEEYEVRARAGEALDRLGTAAIAISVATLLRPMISQLAPDADPPPLPRNGSEVRDAEDSEEWELVLLEPLADATSGEPDPLAGSTPGASSDNGNEPGQSGRSSDAGSPQDAGPAGEPRST
jgi:HEAT repeat protein